MTFRKMFFADVLTCDVNLRTSKDSLIYRKVVKCIIKNLWFPQ